jgi:hypothetical protein
MFRKIKLHCSKIFLYIINLRAIELGRRLNAVRDSFNRRTEGINQFDWFKLSIKDPELMSARQSLGSISRRID